MFTKPFEPFYSIALKMYFENKLILKMLQQLTVKTCILHIYIKVKLKSKSKPLWFLNKMWNLKSFKVLPL